LHELREKTGTYSRHSRHSMPCVSTLTWPCAALDELAHRLDERYTDPRHKFSLTLVVLLALETRTVTAGMSAHACAGTTLAVAIAQAGVRAVLEASLDLASFAEGVLYRPSVNTRILVWHGKESAS
jgi:hypothetical protein